MSKNKVEKIVWDENPNTAYKSEEAEVLWRDTPITAQEAISSLQTTITQIEAAAGALAGIAKIAHALHDAHPTGKDAVRALDTVEGLLFEAKQTYFDDILFFPFKK